MQCYLKVLSPPGASLDLVALTFWKNKNGQFAFVLDMFCEPKQKCQKLEGTVAIHTAAVLTLQSPGTMRVPTTGAQSPKYL